MKKTTQAPEYKTRKVLTLQDFQKTYKPYVNILEELEPPKLRPSARRFRLQCSACKKSVDSSASVLYNLKKINLIYQCQKCGHANGQKFIIKGL